MDFSHTIETAIYEQNHLKNDSYTVNVYRYKTIRANANTSVIPTTWKSLSPYVEIL